MLEPYTFRDSGLVGHRCNAPAVTFCFAAPFDSVCTRLNADYIEQAWQHLARTLADFGLEPASCEWGWGHPGLMWTPSGAWEDSPFTGVGWLMLESAAESIYSTRPRPDWWLDVWDEVDARLRICDPPLFVAQHGYRSSVIRGSNNEVLALADGAVGLAVLTSNALDDVFDWRGRPDAGFGPWAELARSLWSRDRSAFDAGLREALRVYSPAAAEIVVRGFASFAFNWMSDDAPLAPPGDSR